LNQAHDLETIDQPIHFHSTSAERIEEKADSVARLDSVIIESQDPYFVATQLNSKLRTKSLCLPIHALTQTDELIESLDITPEDKAEPVKDIRFNLQIQTVAKAIQKGETVILYGQLSPDLYHALEPLLADPPQLSLFNSATPETVSGRLKIISSPLGFTPALAQHRQRHMRLPDLWQDYKAQLSRDFSAEQQAEVDSCYTKIRRFYELANQVTHGPAEGPQRLHISYTRLKKLVQAQLNKSNLANPLKDYFHHDYDHRSEAYAYLNVLAKYLFSTEPTVDLASIRPDKLAGFPANSHYAWRRLNCLNPSALQTIFADQTPSFKSPPLDQLDKDDFKHLPRVVDPQHKLAQRLNTRLREENLVTLKGEPGSGKTYGAQQYANQSGRQMFWGESAIESWLNPLGDTEKERVLIIDEVNMATPDYWNFLSPLAAAGGNQGCEIFYKGKPYTLPGGKHKVIFTCNPEYYPSRAYQCVVQDSAQLYVKSWTRETLSQHIINPQLAAWAMPISTAATDVSAPRPFKLDTAPLLDAIQLAAHLQQKSPLAEEKPTDFKLNKKGPVTTELLTLRDIQQLIYRLKQYPEATKDEDSWRQAIYEVCMLEWGRSFPTVAARVAFQQQLALLVQPKVIEMSQFQGMAAHVPILEKIAKTKGYFLCKEQKEWLLTAIQNMDLATKAIEEKSPKVKLGLLFEGGSGLGKTSLLLALAEARGLKPCTSQELLDSPPGADFTQHYIHFTPGSSLTEDQALLSKAFNQGCKVIMDELNLSPVLESLLNQLLSGKNPDNSAPTHPGFYLFASQNNTAHAGSKPSSLALKNRLHVLYTELTPPDLEEIAQMALVDKIPEVSLREQHTKAISYDFASVKKQHPLSVNTRTFLQGLGKIRESFRPAEPHKLGLFGRFSNRPAARPPIRNSMSRSTDSAPQQVRRFGLT